LHIFPTPLLFREVSGHRYEIENAIQFRACEAYFMYGVRIPLVAGLSLVSFGSRGAKLRITLSNSKL